MDLLWRRAAMTPAIFPDSSARAEWLLAGIRDLALSHWVRALPLDGGDDEDAETSADTAIPDDDDDLDDTAFFSKGNHYHRGTLASSCARLLALPWQHPCLVQMFSGNF